jgi:uncharacterized protein (TIGR02246 family)
MSSKCTGMFVMNDEQAIRELVATWLAASKAGNLATLLGLMSDDVIFMVPGKEPFGKAEFAAASQGMKGVEFEGTSEIVELKVLGEWAWIRNRLRIVVTPPGRTSIVRSGYTLTILRRNQEGRWQLARDANLLTTETGPA